jgi:ribonuclease R
MLSGDKKLQERYSFLMDTVLEMNALCDILTEKRADKGSIDLDVKESSITVDKNGNIEITATARDKAHKIIEEFMILANVTVAEYMYYLDKPFVYRIHEKPTPEKLENFYAFLKGLGIKYKRKKDQVFSKDFQTVLQETENTPAFTLINRVMLRSMQKAKYSPDCVGHFGLSEEHYCHFTSPIRRYPDLVVHRIIKDFLSGEENLEEKYGSFVVDASVQSSEKERNATEAERAVDDYYKILYISDYQGEEFDAVVSGVTNFGVFAELSNGVEGLIRIETLRGRRYELDRERYVLSNGKYAFRLGQPIKIKVAGVNIMDKRAEFVLAE